MLIDIHTHLINPAFNFAVEEKNVVIKMFLQKSGYSDFNTYLQNFELQLKQSKLDRAVLIGIENSSLSASNDDVLSICNSDEHFLYGVNLNPFAKDIEFQIINAVKNRAVLVKILPSYQQVDLADERCVPFFELLKEHNLPLLVHTGFEHTLYSKNQELNNPQKLKKAAEIGVKIICAHCGSRMFLHERNYFAEWAKLALAYENVYGDLSAMLNPLRLFDLSKIVTNTDLSLKVIFGTDYPAFPVIPFSNSSGNIFIDNYKYFEKIGLTDAIFANAEKVLNL